ncbi:hypothetical protein [Vineibacter terrae]|uniref:hypothetical protein n=1 Tax=Vineibacter terrae TaxID=2586908 RepID=UPI0015B68EB7|nr:hypothetical protein [Vineibacter terrae]
MLEKFGLENHRLSLQIFAASLPRLRPRSIDDKQLSPSAAMVAAFGGEHRA